MASDNDTGIGKGREIQRATPFRDEDVWQDMERMMERFSMPAWPRLLRDWPGFGDVGQLFQARMPRVDVIDGDREIKVRAELPGVDRNDLEVSVGGDAVLIKGSTRREEKDERENYFRSEISHGEFCRSVALPAAVDSEQAKAAFRDGILELTLPKTEARQRRTVTIE